MKATIRDPRLKTRELIAATDRGEEVIITFRGRQRARLVPLAPAVAADRNRNPAFAMWNDQEGSVSYRKREDIESHRIKRALAMTSLLTHRADKTTIDSNTHESRTP